MSDLVAFALTADYEGTVEIEGEQVPVFGGGLLNVGDGDFDVAQALDAGGGTIAVHAGDAPLIGLLDEYPALKRVAVPEDATPVSRYDRVSTSALREQASVRDIDGAGGAARGAVVDALERQDVAIAEGDLATANSIRPGSPDDGLDKLNKAQLVELAETNDVAVDGGATNPQIVAALREAGVRKEA